MRTVVAALIALVIAVACGGPGGAPASATPTVPSRQSAPHTAAPSGTDVGGYGY